MTKAFREITRSLSPALRALRADIPDTMKGFDAMAAAAMRAGALPEKTKELIALALGVAAHCDGCLGFHVKALGRLGATRAEVEESARRRGLHGRRAFAHVRRGRARGIRGNRRRRLHNARSSVLSQTREQPARRRRLARERPWAAFAYNRGFSNKNSAMRVSRYFLATLKEAPAEAELASHRLMLRAGMIKRLAAGIYTWLPLGLRVLRKVEAIVREEMNRAGAIELLMPVVQPAELWQETGRWGKYGPELLRLKDRHERDFIVQPTSEEVITDIARKDLAQLQAAADQFLSHPDQVPRRDPAALRRDALARVRDEGRLFVRRRPGGDAEVLPGDVRRVRAHLHADGPHVPRRCRRHRPDRRQRVARIPGARGFGRGRDRLVPRVRLRGERRARRGGRARRRRAPPPAEPMQKVPTPGKETCEDVALLLGLPLARTVKCIMLATDAEGRAGAHLDAADPRRPCAERSQDEQGRRPREVPLGERGRDRRRDRVPSRLPRPGRDPEGDHADRRSHASP